MLKLTDAELANLRLQAWRALDEHLEHKQIISVTTEYADDLLKWLLQPRRDKK